MREACWTRNTRVEFVREENARLRRVQNISKGLVLVWGIAILKYIYVSPVLF